MKRYEALLTPASVGAVCELEVCADLLKRGWHVFRSVSYAAGADLVAVDDVDTILIEVRAAMPHKSRGGALSCSTIPRGRYDILAKVGPDGRIEYVPDFDEWRRLRGSPVPPGPQE